MSLKRRLNQLQRKVSKKSKRGGTRDLAAEEAKRWEMTERIFELTPEDLREAFVAALMEREEAGFSTKRARCLESWICDLGFDRTRLPDDLAPETMRNLLRVYLEDPPHECIGEVCDQCGLYRPHRSGPVTGSAYFDSCPHCGCREWTPSYAVGVWSQREAKGAETRKLDNAKTKPGEPAQTEGASALHFDGEPKAAPYFGDES